LKLPNPFGDIVREVFPLNPAGTLSLRQAAHFVSGILFPSFSPSHFIRAIDAFRI
jgi:hypothetical protein